MSNGGAPVRFRPGYGRHGGGRYLVQQAAEPDPKPPGGKAGPEYGTLAFPSARRRG